MVDIVASERAACSNFEYILGENRYVVPIVLDKMDLITGVSVPWSSVASSTFILTCTNKRCTLVF